MSSTDPPRPLPPEAVARLHGYFAAFLSPAAADEAVRDLARELAPGDEDERLLEAAHAVLVRRISVPRDLEIAVLVEDLAVPAGAVARIVNVPRQTVDALIESEGLRPAAEPPRSVPSAIPTTAEPDPQPVEGDPAPIAAAPTDADDVATPDDGIGAVARLRERPVRSALFALIGAAVAVVATLAISGGGEPAGDGPCRLGTQQPVCVGDSRLTHVVDASGTPGAPRTRFDVGEPVKLWFTFDVADRSQPHVLDYAWFREGRTLYASSFQLPPGGRVNLTLAEPFAGESGEYRVEVRRGDELLIERRFSIGDV